jgi:taurine dioxygenase
MPTSLYRHPTGPRVLNVRPEGTPAPVFDHVDVEPLGATIGALIRGVNLAELSDEVAAELDQALLEWKVLFFRDQHLTREAQVAFARRWGPLTDDRLLTGPARDPRDLLVEFTRDAATAGLENEWHTDGTFRPVPTLGTVLQATHVPAAGGDTLFADMATAYDNLPGPLRARIDGLAAVHDWSLGSYAEKYGDHLGELQAQVPPVTHPVVLPHPRTRRKTLFVNRLFTKEIVGVEPDEGAELLELLCRQAEIPEYQCRFHWTNGSLAFWDNLAVQHYGVNDYFPQPRVMTRTAILLGADGLRVE